MPIPSTTLEGRLTDDPQRNQRNPNLVEFSIAEGTRYQDKKTGEWKDGQTLFARCKVWDTTLGNNIMNTLRKGMDVVALADVKQNSWTDQQTGQKRSMVEFTVTNIGVGLRHATAQVMPNPQPRQCSTEQWSDVPEPEQSVSVPKPKQLRCRQFPASRIQRPVGCSDGQSGTGVAERRAGILVSKSAGSCVPVLDPAFFWS